MDESYDREPDEEVSVPGVSTPDPELETPEQQLPLPDWGSDGEHGSDREGQGDEGLVSPGAEYSAGTHVGADTARVDAPRVERSPANPSALVEGNQVGDGTELEEDDDDRA